MAKTDVSDPKALKEAVRKYLGEFPGDLICALQLWYEGLGGQGVPTPAEMAAIESEIAEMPGFKDVGGVRYEKFGVQKSYKISLAQADVKDRKMIQHIFKRDGFYKEPDGKVLKVITSELWNLRCFEFSGGKLVGPMIKIHPESDRAKALVEVV